MINLFNRSLNKGLFYFSTSRVKMQRELQYLYGINSVQIAMHCNRRKLHQLYITDSEGANLNSRVANIINRARKMGLQIQFLPKQTIEKFCPNQPHQNVVLKCDKIQYIPIVSPDDLLEKKVCVYLDQITDPQNFGAIIRSCYYFKIDNLIVSNKSKCPLNSTVSKTSSGAVQLINISALKNNPVDFFKAWKQGGGKIICTGMPDPECKIQHVYLDEFHKKPRTQNIIILVGSEGFGVSRELINISDELLSIRKLHSNTFPGSLVDSLNVNAALASILFEVQKNK